MGLKAGIRTDELTASACRVVYSRRAQTQAATLIKNRGALFALRGTTVALNDDSLQME